MNERMDRFAGVQASRLLGKLAFQVRHAARHPNEEAIQNDIEDLSSTLPHLRGKKAAEFLDLSLLKNMEEEGFFKRLQAK